MKTNEEALVQLDEGLVAAYVRIDVLEAALTKLNFVMAATEKRLKELEEFEKQTKLKNIG